MLSSWRSTIQHWLSKAARPGLGCRVYHDYMVLQMMYTYNYQFISIILQKYTHTHTEYHWINSREGVPGGSFSIWRLWGKGVLPTMSAQSCRFVLCLGRHSQVDWLTYLKSCLAGVKCVFFPPGAEHGDVWKSKTYSFPLLRYKLGILMVWHGIGSGWSWKPSLQQIQGWVGAGSRFFSLSRSGQLVEYLAMLGYYRHLL